MLYVQILARVTHHPHLPVTPNTVDTKLPKYLADDLQIFDHSGLYIHVIKMDAKKQYFYLVLCVTGMMLLLFSNQWPYWMQEAAW